MSIKLPPLPPMSDLGDAGASNYGYDEADMQAYALAAIREQEKWSHHTPKLLTEADAAADLAGTPRPGAPTAVEPAAQSGSVGEWKDHDTAKLVNELRDIAVTYAGAQQLRERIAHAVRPLTDKLEAQKGTT